MQIISKDFGVAKLDVKIEGGALIQTASIPLDSILDQLAQKVKDIRPDHGIEDVAVDSIVALLKAQIK